MKKIFFLSIFALAFFTAEAQKVYNIWPIKYGRTEPTFSPRLSENHTWFNTSTSRLKLYNRVETAWEDVSLKSAYAEMSLNGTTTSISFAAVTPAPVEGLTVGLISGFTIVSDSLLRYDGLESAVFKVSYSGAIAFAEAANLISGYVEINGTEAGRTKFRQTQTLTTENENISGSGLITLAPGDLVRFMFFPAAHTGSDILSINQFNINLTEIN